MKEEIQIRTADRVLLRGRVWRPGKDPRGTLCLVHGLGEHGGRYSHLAAFLNRHGYILLAIDLRGHGRSEGKRGHTPGYAAMLDDIRAFLEEAEKLYPEKPVFLYGHSMGGNLVLNYALHRRPSLEGIIATAPLLRSAFEPPRWKMLLASLMLGIWPSLSLSSGLSSADLSRDPEVVRAYDEDPLVHDRVTPRFLEIRRAGVRAVERAGELSLPLLLMHGDADRVTSCPTSRLFADRAGSICTLKIWPGLYHEIHNEPERGAVFDYLLSWLEGSSGRKRV
ncbi:MAG: lysophospholipase [Candidatus Krumholzibacteriota bacterium]|nr:lysophospholipase [Candidatus Krumholzibacteriota bacterium]